MESKLINIGYGNFIARGRMIAIVGPDSMPVKRIIQDARDERRLIDATCGRRTRAVIIADSDHVILSAIQPETITRRFESPEESSQDEEEGETNSHE